MRLSLLLLPLSMLACRPATPDLNEVDEDGDGYSAADDCNDADAAVNPGATEICNGIDDNCSGSIDDDASDASTWYRDGDLDGYGDADSALTACDAPDGYVANGDDCNDQNADYHPGATEDDCTDANDYNCDGSSGFADADADGFPACEDCDDTDAAVNPLAAEACDGIDNDCDGQTDEAGASGESTWYADADGDGYGNPTSSVRACDQPAGYVSDATDCNDGSAAAYPGATEVCDGIDNNCNGEKDTNAADQKTWYADADGDGYGNPASSQQACTKPAGYVEDATDCDDSTNKANPGAAETCDGFDNDCDEQIDEGFDKDGDGYTSCAGDCDDDDAAIHPGADEICDGKDNDCNGSKDIDAVDAPTWYVDYDGDGYGTDKITQVKCTKPAGFSATKDDCNDLDADFYPGADLGCDGEDYDCDGKMDNDADGDGFPDIACGGTDCDDADATLKPEAGGSSCALGAMCSDIKGTDFDEGDGVYTIDPDGYGTGVDPMDVWCDMTTDGGGWTLCASLTKGYVPAHMLYNEAAYSFQDRLSNNGDFVFDIDAPARSTTTWNNSELQNHGQFCRALGSQVTKTRIEQKSWNYGNNYGATLKNANYHLTKKGIYKDNLFTQWFTNNASARVFTRLSGDQLYVQNNNNNYGGPYTTPNIGWSSGNEVLPYTHSTNPWNDVGSNSSCTGCTNNGAGYSTLPYGQTGILNDLGHAYWTGIPNVRYGWSDCTANGNCNYHESGYGVWLFWVQ